MLPKKTSILSKFVEQCKYYLIKIKRERGESEIDRERERERVREKERERETGRHTDRQIDRSRLRERNFLFKKITQGMRNTYKSFLNNCAL